MPGAAGLRAMLIAEIALFALASLLHQGILAHGYEHSKAAVAEGIIALVLAVGLGIAVHSPDDARAAATWTQAFALLGVCVGLALILVGVGPRSGLDYAIHAVMAATLVAGLIVARKMLH